MQFTRTMLKAAAIAGLLTATPALADAITLDQGDVGTTFTLNYNGYGDNPNNVVNGLTGQTTFTLTAATDTSYTFSYSVTNTSTDPIDSRISIFGFNTDPNISGATSTGVFSQTATTSNVPSGFGQVDVCFKNGGGPNCSGGGSAGLTDGQTGTGTLTLNFAAPVTALTLSDFFVRYQSIRGAGNITSGVGSGTTTTTSSTTTSTSTGGTPVPEPGMVGLFAGGLIGLAMLRRRRRTTVRLAAA